MARERPSALALFDADFLGWGDYPPDELDREPVISLEAWRAMEDKTPDLVADRVIAIHRILDRHLWAVAAGCRTAGGKVHLEVGYLRTVQLRRLRCIWRF